MATHYSKYGKPTLFDEYNPATDDQMKSLKQAIDFDSGAYFSDCRKYRYALWRIWDRSKPILQFIGLNPSTANENTNDRTIERLNMIVKHNGYGGYYMTNLFAIISKEPEILMTCVDPLGENNKYLMEINNICSAVVYAWGGFKFPERISVVKSMFPDALCLGKNKNGSPKHPLFLKKTTQIIKY